jgi:hypothetical protein
VVKPIKVTAPNSVFALGNAFSKYALFDPGGARGGAALSTLAPMDMTPHFPIYMDYGATTPVDQRVVDKMIPWLREHFGNPASRSHAWGWEAERRWSARAKRSPS